MSVPTDITTHAGIRGMRIDRTPHLLGTGICVLNPLVIAVADDPIGVTTLPVAAYRA